MKKYLIYLSLVTMACNSTETTKDNFSYPVTQKADSVHTYFGTQVEDPYQWLEDDMSEETAEWVKAQNGVTFDYLNQIDFRDKIKSRITKLLDYEKLSAPSIEGDYEYWSKNDGLQNQSVVYRRHIETGEEEVFMDPNSWSSDGTIALRGRSFTKDGSLAVLTVSIGGSDWSKMIVMDAIKKEVLEDTLDVKFSSASWLGNDGFYYSTYDQPADGSQLSGTTQYHKLMYHKLGTPYTEDKLVFGGEEQPNRYIYGLVTEDEQYLLVNAAQNTSGNRLYIKDLKDPKGDFVLFQEDYFKSLYPIHNEGNVMYFHTNIDAPNWRVVKTTFDKPGKENWVEVIPESENVLSANTGGGKIFASYLIDAATKVYQYNLDGEEEWEIKLPGIGGAYGFGAKTSDTELYYLFTSFTYPSTIFKYSISDGSSELYSAPEVDFKPEDYETKQIFYTSKDGTKVPMFIVYKKGIELNGKNPTYLYGYGGFNVSLGPGFNPFQIVWLENGGIYAQPNIRGGGEYGEEWHEAGTKMNKQNVFDDFIAAGEYLIDNNYTSSDYLTIAGGSNGGLLVGATMTQRPDLAKVALPAVGVLDMLRYHTFTAGAGWSSDYGTAEDSKEMFEYLKEYSPYHALKPGTTYPATLVTTADHDDRVVPAHSFKFSSRLQEYNTSNNPVMIRIETNAGHGSVSLEQRINLAADQYAFAWYNMGVIPPVAKEDF